MPKVLKAALSARKVQTLTKPGSYSDGGGLELQIREGNKTWTLRMMVNGKRVVRGLGSYPAVGLADARALAVEHREALLQGKDLNADARAQREAEAKAKAENEEREAGIPTFAEVAEQVIELRRPTWKSDRHAEQWRESLRNHAYPAIGHKRIDAISTAEVLGVLTTEVEDNDGRKGSLWNVRAETATRVRQRMEAIFDFAVVVGKWRTDNPANGSLTKVLPRRPRQKKHHRALPYAEVPAAIAAVKDSTANPITRLAFEFLALTGTRSGEVRGCRWSEIDIEGATWVIPSHRMKVDENGDHRVPLSTRAVAILQEARELTGGEGLVFPGKWSKDGMLSDMAFTMLLRRCEVEAVPHGFRASLKDWMAECSSASWAVTEAVLAHKSGERASLGYLRTDFLEQRRPLMEQWADYVGCQP